MVSKFVAEQLSWPRGIAGWLTRRLMNRGNARLNEYALGQLALSPDDRVLELGFGGGVLIPHLLEAAAFVQGIDRSSDAVAAARRRFSNSVRSGRARFDLGSVEAIPLPDASVDKAITVHTVYFWPTLEDGLAEFARVLRPSGRLVIGFLPKEHMDTMDMPPSIFTPRQPDDVAEAMGRSGFEAIELQRPDDSRWLTATALKR
jgi:ubiquinone/menaquinone biosynthesis C-methylase UbiE